MTKAMLPVFLSVTTPHLPAQRAFLAQLESAMRDNGLAPHSVRHPPVQSVPPLAAVCETMSGCVGTVAVALARRLIVRGVEFIGGAEERFLVNRYTTTIWSHVELALAFQLGQPILLFKEDRVCSEGLLDLPGTNTQIEVFSLEQPNQAWRVGTECLELFRERVEDFASAGRFRRRTWESPQFSFCNS
jgi:hypothetical protein